MVTLQRVEQEAVSCQNMANAIESLSKARSNVTRSQATRHLEGLRARSRAWLGYVVPKHKAGKLIQRITKGTLRATEAWTNRRHTGDDQFVELDYELAVALANVTEGAARATVLKVTQTEPSHGFVAWQAQVDGYAPNTCDAQEMQGCEGVETKAHSMVTEGGRV